VSVRWFIAVFAGVAGVLAAHRIYDPDFWLHLAAGQHIWATGAVPATNLFSFTHPDHAWIDVYWLYQVAVAGAWRVGQEPAAIVLKVAGAAGLAVVVLRGYRGRREPVGLLTAGALVLGWLVMLPRLTDRPELFSFLCLAATISLARAGRWWWCVPVQVVWANVQGYFVWGPIIMVLAAVSGRVPVKAVVAVAAASLVSPFGWRNWQLVADFGRTMRVFGGAIEELASPFDPVVWAQSGSGWLLVLFLGLAGVVLWLGRARVGRWEWLLAAASLGPALVAQRAVPVFVLCCWPGLLAGLRAFDRPGSRLGWLALAAVPVAFAVAPCSAPPARPAAAVAAVPTGARVLNVDFHTGGYVLAASDRRVPVFIDGRLEAYPAEFIRRYFDSQHDPVALRELAAEFGATHAFVVKDRARTRQLCGRLAGSPRWERVFADGAAEVFARR
jgi:hypothetical protein